MNHPMTVTIQHTVQFLFLRDMHTFDPNLLLMTENIISVFFSDDTMIHLKTNHLVK